jgi:hypothetical protein
MHSDDTDLKRTSVFQGSGRGRRDFLVARLACGFLEATGFFKNADLDFDGNFRAADCSGILELCYTA